MAGMYEHMLFSLLAKNGIVSGSRPHFESLRVDISFCVIVNHLSWNSLVS